MCHRLILVILVLILIGLAEAQNPTRIWGGRIYDLNFNGFDGEFKVFTITLQNTGAGIERYCLNAFIVAKNPKVSKDEIVVKRIWNYSVSSPISPRRTAQMKLDFRDIGYRENLSYKLVVQLAEYAFPHRIIDETFYILKP